MPLKIIRQDITKIECDAIVYATVSQAVCNIRMNKCMAENWSEDIDNDFKNRGKK